MLNEKDIHHFVHAFIKEVWRDQNPKKIPEYYSPDFVGYFNGTELFYYDDLYKRMEVNQKNFKQNALELHMAFPISHDKVGVQFTLIREGFDGVKRNDNMFFVAEIREKKIHKMWIFTENPGSYLPR